jgi:large subunit ribosomal protein L1
MQTLSKRLKLERQKIKKDNYYSVKEAVQLLKVTASARFIESAEAHISLNLDPKYADQQLRTTVILPHGTGRSIKIAVLVSSDKVAETIKLGADIAGSDDLIETISKGILDFDLLVATPDMMPKLAKLGRVLGPKGLMPSPKAGTVTTDINQTLQEFKKGKLEYRVDKTGIVHINFGKVNFSESQLIENLVTFFQSVEKNRPTGVKGKYIKKLAICSTMGPSIFIDLTSFV